MPSALNRLAKPGGPEPPEEDTGRGTRGHAACQPAVQKHDHTTADHSADRRAKIPALAQDDRQQASAKDWGTAT